MTQYEPPYATPQPRLFHVRCYLAMRRHHSVVGTILESTEPGFRPQLYYSPVCDPTSASLAS